MASNEILEHSYWVVKEIVGNKAILRFDPIMCDGGCGQVLGYGGTSYEGHSIFCMECIQTLPEDTYKFGSKSVND